MALKVLGQSNPAANTLTSLYTVPGGKAAVVSTLVVCNTAALDALFRIAVRVAGAGISAPQYVVYEQTLPALSTITLTLGLTLAATDVLSVQANTALVAFSAFGDES